MSESESIKLKIGDKVSWEGDVNDLGQVIDVDHIGVKIQWDIGQIGTIDHRDMAKIHKHVEDN